VFRHTGKMRTCSILGDPGVLNQMSYVLLIYPKNRLCKIYELKKHTFFYTSFGAFRMII